MNMIYNIPNSYYPVDGTLLVAEFMGGGAYEPNNIYGDPKTTCDPSSEFSAMGCSFF